MRCSACGARNSEDAVWCTQCYADVRVREAEPPVVSEGVTDGPTTGRASAEPSVSGREPGDAATPDTEAGAPRDVRERDDEVEWRCTACDGWSPLVAPACVVCGTQRRGFGEPARAPRTVVSETGVVVSSLLLPGLGHVLAGRVGTGIARAVLAVLWLLGGIALVVGNDGIRTLPGWLLLVSFVGLWAATVLDARSLTTSSGSTELLGTRQLAALVLAVTVGLVVSAAVVLVGGT